MFPLFYNGVHCGSVEVSLTFNSILEELYDIDNHPITFLIAKNMADEIFGEVYLKEFVISSFSDELVLHENLLSVGKTFDLSEKENKFIKKQIKENKHFGIEAKHSNTLYLLQFIPIKGFCNKRIAYLVQYMPDVGISRIRKDYIMLGIIATVVGVLLFIIVVIALKDRSRLKRLSLFDSLTGIANRQYLFSLTSKEISRTFRSGQPLSVVFFDLDNFQKFNDEYGHVEGDRILVEVAKIINNFIKPYDIFGRLSGVNFALVLPNYHIEESKVLAEKIRLAICQSTLHTEYKITISAGISAYVLDDSIEALFNRADLALNKAKSMGKNQVCID